MLHLQMLCRGPKHPEIEAACRFDVSASFFRKFSFRADNHRPLMWHPTWSRVAGFCQQLFLTQKPNCHYF